LDAPRYFEGRKKAVKTYFATPFARAPWRWNNLLSPIAALALGSVTTTASADVFTLNTSIVTPATGIVNNTKSSNTGPVETSYGGFTSLASFSSVAGPGLLTGASSVDTDFTNGVPPPAENGGAIAFASMDMEGLGLAGWRRAAVPNGEEIGL
jgi:hypothetical protein